MDFIRYVKKAKPALTKNFERYVNIFSNEIDELEKLWLQNKQDFLHSSLQKEYLCAKKNIIIRWLSTQWCNYKCDYCFQKFHGKTKLNHCFEAFSCKDWIQSFDSHFGNQCYNLILTITGGEPMLDVKNMKIFLNEICSREYLLNIRIDTNGSWKSIQYKDVINKNKIWLNISFHPTQVKLDKFLDLVNEYCDDGYNVGMIDFVLSNENKIDFEKSASIFLKKNIPVNPNPRLDCRYSYDKDALSILKNILPEQDFKHKYERITTYGKLCLYPAVAYQMNPEGLINVGCHYWMKNNFVNKNLPKLFKTYTKCPQEHCTCLDMFSFQKGFKRNYHLNPLLSYRIKLLEQYKKYLNKRGLLHEQ